MWIQFYFFVFLKVISSLILCPNDVTDNQRPPNCPSDSILNGGASVLMGFACLFISCRKQTEMWSVTSSYTHTRSNQSQGDIRKTSCQSIYAKVSIYSS